MSTLRAALAVCLLWALLLAGCEVDPFEQNETGPPDSTRDRGRDGAAREARTEAAPDQKTGTAKTCQYSLSCKTKADCTAMGFMDCKSGTCIQCAAAGDCITPYKGCSSAGLCQFCILDSDCTISSVKIGTGKCDSVLWSCIRCDSNSDCAGQTTPYTTQCASITAGQGTYKMCLGCKLDSDCASSVRKGCDKTKGYCDLCTSDTECCNNTPGCGLVCNKAKGRCECTSDQQCLAAFGVATYKCKTAP